MCSTIKYSGVSDYAIGLRLFLYTLIKLENDWTLFHLIGSPLVSI